MSNNAPIRLRIPQPSLSSFKVFELNEEAAQAWTDSLSIANTRLAAQQLRHAIHDLNRVQATPDLRFRIMEALRPNLLVVLSNLAKRFLNQPLTMQEDPRQMAELADSLYGLATTGYSMVAVHTIQQQSELQNINPARLVCEAIHRGLSFCGRNILLALQLYQPVEEHLWLTLHQLYLLAERQQLANLPVSDPLTGSGTITCAYLQALMLGCSKPNQLRQTDLAGIYRGLQQWSEHVELSSETDEAALFLIDLASDTPPVYSDMYSGETNANHRFLKTDALLNHLQELRKQCRSHGKAGIQFDENTSIPSNILDHLIASLSTMSMRNFTRIPSDKSLWIAIGLSNTHYHMAGGRTFTQLLYGDNYRLSAEERLDHNPFLDLPEAVVSVTPAGQDATTEEEQQETPAPEVAYSEPDAEPQQDMNESDDTVYLERRYPLHCLRMFNASPAGYGLEWSNDMIGDLRTGNVVCVREGDNDDWAIAAVRWVNQPKGGSTVVGLELLSPKAAPYGALIHHKTSPETEPMRVLLLPEIPLVGQPHTLITPRAGFKEGQKVSLLRSGEEFLIQLQRQVSVTGSFARFDFRYIKQLEEVLAEDKTGPMDSAYDSVWSNI